MRIFSALLIDVNEHVRCVIRRTRRTMHFWCSNALVGNYISVKVGRETLKDRRELEIFIFALTCSCRCNTILWKNTHFAMLYNFLLKVFFSKFSTQKSNLFLLWPNWMHIWTFTNNQWKMKEKEASVRWVRDILHHGILFLGCLLFLPCAVEPVRAYVCRAGASLVGQNTNSLSKVYSKFQHLEFVCATVLRFRFRNANFG